MSEDQDFYRAFEEKHRGSRELIKARLEVYSPFIEPLLTVYPKARAVDLGCGRGEWLELAQSLGFAATGVDLDAGMLKGAEELGLDVELVDAIEYLERQPDESIAVISGFHIVEHIPFAALQSLVKQACRVLAPGGLLILETPNPENVTVGACSFYMDPTHERPLPPNLLSFLPEYYGFSRTKILRLQEQERVRDGSPLKMLDVFDAVSPDYAVVAQKAGSKQATGLLNTSFKEDYGVSLADLALRYEQQLNEVMSRATAVAENAEAKAGQAVEKAEHAETKALQAEAQADRAEAKAQQAEIKAGNAETRAHNAEVELEVIHRSRSWRLTAPLRWMMFQGRLLRELGPAQRSKALARKLVLPVLRVLIIAVSARPGLRRACVTTAQKLGLYSRLRSVYLGGSFLRAGGMGFSAPSGSGAPESVDSLNPQARQIFFDLQAAVERNRKQK